VAPAAAFPSASVRATADPTPCPIRRGGHAPRALAPVPAVARPTRRRLHQPSHAPPASVPPSPVRRGRRLPKQLNLAMKSATTRCTSSASPCRRPNTRASPSCWTRAGRPGLRRRPRLRSPLHVAAVGERSHEFSLSSSTCSAPYPSHKPPGAPAIGSQPVPLSAG
jgi:hypothetical protein